MLKCKKIFQNNYLILNTFVKKGYKIFSSNSYLFLLQIQHLTWVNQYKAVRSSIGIKWPGYMIHESCVWSEQKHKWHFLPRRCSHEPYNETKDEVMGCNYLITADNNFKNVQALEVRAQNFHDILKRYNKVFYHGKKQTVQCS